MPELTIDRQTLQVPEGTTLLEAARRLGVEIPTLCYLPGYPHHTSCMVCLVEDLDSGILLPACVAPASPDQRIRTDGQRVAAARRRSLELLLSEHAGDCEAPCTRACPAHPDLPAMIRRIARRDLPGALTVLLERLPLAGTLAAICPAPCERACRRGRVDSPVSIRELKQAAVRGARKAGNPMDPRREGDSGKAAAVVGSGPAGMAAAYFLARLGHRCTVFDDHESPGGPLRQLAAEGRLSAVVLAGDLAELERLGVAWQTGTAVTPQALVALGKTHDAVVLAPGSPQRLELLAPGQRFDRRTTAGNVPGVFACGNATRPRPSAMAVQAVADGRRAALAAAAFLRGLVVVPEPRRFDSHLGVVSSEDLSRLAAESLAVAEGLRRRGTGGTDAGRVEAGTGGVGAAGAESLRPEILEEALRCLRCDCIRKASCALRELSGRYGANAKHLLGDEPGQGKATAGGRVTGSGGLSLDQGKCIKCGICVRIAERAGALPGLAFSGRGYDLRLRVPFGEDLGRALGTSARECVKDCPTGALAWCREGAEP